MPLHTVALCGLKNISQRNDLTANVNILFTRYQEEDCVTTDFHWRFGGGLNTVQSCYAQTMCRVSPT